MKLGLVTVPGNGEQIFSWIHEADLCRAIVHLIKNVELNGPFNIVAGERTSLKEFLVSAGEKANQFFSFPVNISPSVLKMLKGEGAAQILKSSYVSNEKLKNSGFVFVFPDINTALKNILN